MSDYVDDSDRDDSDSEENTINVSDDEKVYQEIISTRIGLMDEWNKQMKALRRDAPTPKHAINTMHLFLNSLSRASQSLAEEVLEDLSKALKRKIYYPRSDDNVFTRFHDACVFLEHPNEYRMERAKKIQEDTDLKFILQHMFVYSGAPRAPPDVLERHFTNCDQILKREYAWSEYFSPGPKHGVSARERENHIVNARTLDEKQRHDTQQTLTLQLCNMMNINGMILQMWKIILDYVPYTRNFVECVSDTPSTAELKVVVEKKEENTAIKNPNDSFLGPLLKQLYHNLYLIHVGNSHNMGNPGEVLYCTRDDKKPYVPVKLPSHRFVAKDSYVDRDHVWVFEYPGDVVTNTFDAPGLMFAVNTKTWLVEHTLPHYFSQSKNDLKFYPAGGGQLFTYLHRQECRGHVRHTNLEMPFGIYFSDSFGPPRFQFPSHCKLEKRSSEIIVCNNKHYKLEMTFGPVENTPLY